MDGFRNRRAVVRTPVTVTVRVTQYLVEQSGGTGEVQPRREQSRTGEGGGGGGRVQGDDQRCTIGGEPLSVCRARRRWRGSCACHAMNLSLKSLELKSEPTDERDELLTTLAPVRSARA